MNGSTKPHIIMMAGGTGGHIFPALAVAEGLRERGFSVSWIGTRKRMEADVVPAAGFEIDFLAIQGLRGKGLGGWLMLPWRLWRALRQAEKIFKKREPALVIGMGGFASGPGGMAAKWLGYPLWIHEQNAIFGMTNRFSAYWANRVFCAFPNPKFEKKGVVVIGNPLRQTFLTAAQQTLPRGKTLRVLIMGGSLGAQVLNERVPEAIAQLPESQRPEIRHQTGKGKEAATRAIYEKHGIKADVVPFVEQAAEAYAWADLVICRAGAMTISELTVMGKPAILIPYPHAVDDHQTHNAQPLTDHGAAILIQQADASVERFQQELSALLQAPEKLVTMGKKARDLAKPNAAEYLVQEVEKQYGV